MEYYISIISALFHLSIIEIIKEFRTMKELYLDNKNSIKYLAIFIVMLLAIFSLLYSFKDLGTFGDFFGGILNPIVGFIGIILIYLTLKTSQETLKITKDELSLTREEFKKSNNIFENQKLEMKLQTFDNKFFKMLDRFNMTVENLGAYNKDHTFQSKKDFFHSILINKFSLENKGIYFPYIHLVFQIIKLIDESNFLNIKQKMYYIDLFKSQIMSEEIMLIVKCISCYKKTYNENFQYILEKYHFFQFINLKKVKEAYPNIVSELDKFNNTAFKKF